MQRAGTGCLLMACLGLGLAFPTQANAQEIAILDNPQVATAHPLPDYSYAGYCFGLAAPPVEAGRLVDVRDFGAVADDEADDSLALLKAFAAAHEIDGPVIVQLPPGRLIVSEVLRVERSHFVLRGAGRGAGGSELYFPRPLKLVDRSGALDELRRYLVENDKRQVERERNIDLPFSEYSWSGGFLWVQKPGTRPASYQEGSDDPPARARLTQAVSGRRGERTLRVRTTARLKAGDVVQVRWFNRRGKSGPLLRELYGDTDLPIGSRHWESPQRALVAQTTTVQSIDGDLLTLGDPLLHDSGSALEADVASWQHLSAVGIEDLALVFPPGDSFGHHLEQGYNGIYLTSVFNGWVRGVRIDNADAGILTENSASLTLADVMTTGQRTAHYSVQIGSVHNVLVSDLQVLNPVIHPLSVNTQSTRSVFLRANVHQRPALDQHAGANHQNLFDNLTLHVHARRDERGPWYPVWDGSGAPYWQPGHGRLNTTWNLRVLVETGAQPGETVRLVGAEEGPDARVIGVSGNRRFEIDYRPAPYLELINHRLDRVPSLYAHQLAQRIAAGEQASSACPR